MIEAADPEIRSDFAVTEEKIKAAGLPATILARHNQAVADYVAEFAKLLGNFKAIEQLETARKGAVASGNSVAAQANRDQLLQRILETKIHLSEKVKKTPHTPLDPNKLPHRTPKVIKRAPRLNKEEFTEFQNPVQLAFNGDPSTLLLVQANPDLPTPQDLAETIEVKFTQEIQDLAASLENNPVKIYNWVRNNIEFVPTYGSIQGASMCLQTKKCNDMDTASLLIALLRTSGISARYAVGTVEIPIDQAMNWVGGFTDVPSGLSFITSGGTPLISLNSGGKTVAAKIEHIWVEAYIDYIPSRGAVHNQGDTWVPMDASFKQYTYTEGVDLQTAVPFDAQAFFDEINATGTIDEAQSSATGLSQELIKSKLDARTLQLETFFTANMPNATVADVLGSKTIVPETFGFVPSALPYKLVVNGGNFSEVSDALRHKVRFRITGDVGVTSLTHEVTVPELAGKRITLGYLAATPEDQQVIDANSGVTGLPAYLINLVPILRLEGTEIARGGSVGMGKTEQFLMDFTVPGPAGGVDVVQNLVTAGAYYAIGLDPQKISSAQLDDLQARMELLKTQMANDPTFIPDSDEVIGQLLHVTVMGYFAELDNYQAVLGSLAKVLHLKPSTSAGIASVDLDVSLLFGVPFEASTSGGMILDVDRIIIAPLSITGETNNAISFVRGSGFLASALEFAVFEQLWKSSNIKGISSTKALELANQLNMPIYRITQQNIAQVLPLLTVPQAVEDDIVNGINAGKEVTIPQGEVSLGQWSGVGYIVEDPQTGAAAYLISGGLAGGATVDKNGLLIGVSNNLIGEVFEKTAGEGFGLFFAGLNWVVGLKTILITPNLSVFERAFLSLLPSFELALSIWVLLFSSFTVGAAIAIGVIAAVIVGLAFKIVLTNFSASTAIFDLFRKLFRYAMRTQEPIDLAQRAGIQTQKIRLVDTLHAKSIHPRAPPKFLAASFT